MLLGATRWPSGAYAVTCPPDGVNVDELRLVAGLIAAVFIELVSSLRCPRAARGYVARGRVRAQSDGAHHLIEGMLGCPVCDAEYAIE